MVKDVKPRKLGIEPVEPRRGAAKLRYSLMAREVAIFCGLIRQEAPRRAVELGTGLGFGAESIVEMSPGCEVISIDYVDRKGERDPEVGPHDASVTYLIADSRTVRLPREWYGATDFLFVDGDHRRNGIVSDTRLALSLVAPGGLIVWHDVMELGSRSELHKRENNGYYVSEYFYKEFPLEIRRIDGTALGIYRAES